MNSITNNNHLPYPADISSPIPSSIGVLPHISSTLFYESHGFGIYQLTTVGTSDEAIRTPVPILISTFSYHKALIANLFFAKFSAMKIHRPLLLVI